MYNVYYINPETGELGILLEEGIDDISKYTECDNAFITVNSKYRSHYLNNAK